MSYIDYKSKEDIQDDTFKQIASLNWNCMIALGDKSVNGAVASMNILYLTCWKKMGSYLPESFGADLKRLEDAINQENIDGYERTRQLLRARELYKALAGALSDAGLLFRATVDSKELGKTEEI